MPSRRGYTAIVAASAALVLLSIVAVPAMTTGALQQKDARRIIAFSSRYDYDTQELVWSTGPLRPADVRQDTAVQFLSPFSKDMQEFYARHVDRGSSKEIETFYLGAEHYSRYNLIRLPGWLGGERDDISSFRAYSAVAISNSCMVRYWGDGRERMEDPCHGDMYRLWDGLAIAGPAAAGVSHGIIDRAKQAALATIDLSVDDKGYIVALKPDPATNGVVGAGRQVDEDASSRGMIAAASRQAGYDLPFPAIASYHLATIMPADMRWGYAGKEGHIVAYYGDGGMGNMIEISAYPASQFPGMVSGDMRFNATAAQQFMNVDQSLKPTAVAGKHAYAWTGDGYSAAAVIGREKDGTELFVTIRATEMDAGQLAKSLDLD